MNEMELEVFRAGDYGDKGIYDEAELDIIASDYDPRMHEAPVTIDHAQSGPAYGWVKSVRRVGDALVASLKDLSDDFVSWLKKGSYRKRSIELYRKFSPTGRPYLRAVSFLGACPPEVKGLADPVFTDEGEFVRVKFQEERESNQELSEDLKTAVAPDSDKPDVNEPEAGEPDADKPNPEATKTGESKPEAQNPVVAKLNEPEPGKPETDKSDADVHAILKERDDLSKQLETLRKEKRRAEMVALCERLKREGRVLPAWEEKGLVNFLLTLERDQTVHFAEAGELTPLEWFQAFLEQMPPQVCLEEVAGEHEGPLPGDMDKTFPRHTDGLVVSPESVETHRRVLAFREKHPDASYTESLALVARQS